MTQAAIMPEWMKKRLDGEDGARGEIELPPDQAESFALFAALGTQWTRHGMTGMRLGIDYSAIKPAAEMMGIGLDPRRFHDLRTMEGAALEEFARARR